MAINVPPGYYNKDRQRAFITPHQFVVNTTPELLLPESFSRLGAVITNAGTESLFVGGDKRVTIANGHAIPAGVSLALSSSAEVWGVVATGPCTVTTLEEQLK